MSNDQMHNPNRVLPEWYVRTREDRDSFIMYDHLASEGFPTVERLRQGILLGCIASALYLAESGETWAGGGWVDGSYVDDNDQGEHWAVAFASEGAVATFYSSESERNPFGSGPDSYDLESYFQGMPETLRAARDKALSLMHDLDFEVDGQDAAITAAMWAEGEQFTATEPWRDVFHNSLWACHQQLLPLNAALIEWQENFELDDEAVGVLVSLYQRRLASKEALLLVDSTERDVFTRSGKVGGLVAAQDMLASIGIGLVIE